MHPTKDTRTDVEKPAATDRPRLRIGRRSREQQPEARHGSNRETIESVVIAFVLAFLFRTFEAEAFVIPTGSMAPTLMGRHKEIKCGQCAWVFSVGATGELDGDGKVRPQKRLTECICPNCRFVNDVRNEPAFKGDRILVLKALYDLPDWMPDALREPKRWDVAVFKYPEEPQINYIKRVVGLPNEELSIFRGNIYTRAPGDTEFHIARKLAEKQRVLRMIVFDNNRQPEQWPADWPARWQSAPADAWRASADGRTFDLTDSAVDGAKWSELTYHHLVSEWHDPETAGPPPQEQLITDFYAYNAGMSDGRYFDDADLHPHWVGDLTLSFTVEVREARGKLRAELVKAGDRFICEFELENGTCDLRKIAVGRAEPDPKFSPPSAQNVISRPGRYSITFANVDDRLTVWVGDKLPFGDGYDYEGLPWGERQRPGESDLRPATVAVEGARVRVSDLVLYRDIYYTHSATGSDYAGYPSGSWQDALSTPSLWDVFLNVQNPKRYTLGPDEFMMCGDNSPRSKDGREWPKGAEDWVTQLARERGLGIDDAALRLTNQQIAQKPGGDVVYAQHHVVRRQLLIGKAFFVYWPHGVPFKSFYVDTPSLGPLGSFRLPFYPHVSRMKLIK